MVAAKPQTQETQGEANSSTASANRDHTASSLAADPADIAAGQYPSSRSQFSWSVSCYDAASSVIRDTSTLHCEYITTDTDSTASYSHLH